MTEKERFLERLAKEKAKGLVSWGFSTDPFAGDLTEEEIYAALNRIQEAVDRGDCVIRTRWTQDETPKPWDVLSDEP